MIAVRAAWAAAWAASWRLMLTLVAIVVIPVGAVAAAFTPFGLASTDVAWAWSVTALFVVSMFVHEVAHASVYFALARRMRIQPDVAGVGSFTAARVVRWSLGTEFDAVISVVGPASGFLCVLPLMALLPVGAEPVGFLLRFPLVLLFVVHVISLVPMHADGRQVKALFGARTPARDGSAPGACGVAA